MLAGTAGLDGGGVGQRPSQEPAPARTSGRVQPLLPGDAGTLPPDALPVDASPSGGERVLLSSAVEGLVELERVEGRWRVARRWRAGHELPAGVYGDAQYAVDGSIVALLKGQGVLRLHEGRAERLDRASGWPALPPLRLLAGAGGLWVAYAPQPGGDDARGGVLFAPAGKGPRFTPVSDRGLATIGRWIEVPERRSVFAATRAGVVELARDGTMKLRSNRPVSSIARSAGTGAIGAVGSAVERWDGARFVPVLFQPPGEARLGDPIDLAISPGGTWYLLYERGRIVVLGPDGEPRALLTPADGVPVTARRLLALPGEETILVGSAQEGAAQVNTGF